MKFLGYALFGFGLLLFIALADAEAPPQALSAFDAYAHAVERRIDIQHHSPTTILAVVDPGSAAEAQMRSGLRLIEDLHAPAAPSGLMHHWRGSAFIPGATAVEFQRLLEECEDYPRIYAPQVLRCSSKVLSDGHRRVDTVVAQKHVITVTLDTAYDVVLHTVSPSRGYQTSRSTQVRELESVGHPDEHALSPADEHGFLWRQNTYWTWEERSGGLIIQVESISLSRPIPAGLGWIVKPFVQSVPRESLEFTLRATAAALRK